MDILTVFYTTNSKHASSLCEVVQKGTAAWSVKKHEEAKQSRVIILILCLNKIEIFEVNLVVMIERGKYLPGKSNKISSQVNLNINPGLH